MTPRIAAVLSLLVLGGCGESTQPTMIEPGFILRVTVPGFTDTTVTGDSTLWRLFGPSQYPPEVQSPFQVTMEMLVLDPPPPLQSPLKLQVIWLMDDPALQTGTYALDPNNYDVTTQLQSNLGVWGAALGQVKLTETTDTSLVGSLSASMVPIYPPGSPLPDIKVTSTFWARRAHPP